MLTENARLWLMRQLDLEAHKRGGIVLAHNVMPDHVHLLVSLPPTLCVATYIGQVKGGIAHEFNKEQPGPEPLAWQEGYGVVSIRKAEMHKVVAYIENQQAIHANRKASRLLERTEPDDS